MDPATRPKTSTDKETEVPATTTNCQQGTRTSPHKKTEMPATSTDQQGPETSANQKEPETSASQKETETSASQGDAMPAAHPGPCLLLEVDGYEPAKIEPQPPQLPEKPSEGAIFKRIYRVMQPRADGSYVIPESVRSDWHNLETRPSVVHLFEK
eukprot:s208_g3.t1